jgi:hypothetical protein
LPQWQPEQLEQEPEQPSLGEPAHFPSYARSVSPPQAGQRTLFIFSDEVSSSNIFEHFLHLNFNNAKTFTLPYRQFLYCII